MDKTCVVYFSVYGSTKSFAEEISNSLSCDIYEIKPLTKYDNNKEHYEILTKIAEAEKNNNDRPVIEKIDIKNYDRVFIGYPIWWYTMPMPVYTFLEQNNWQGKTVIPFCTHDGSRESTTYNTIKEICKGANVLDGLDILGKKFVYSQSIEIEDWLKKLGIK